MPELSEKAVAPATASDNRPTETAAKLPAAARCVFPTSTRPLPFVMTITQAAEFLDVSPAFIRKLIKQGELPCRVTGKRRRIPSDALLLFREKLYQRAKIAADEMVRIGQESGLSEIDGLPPKAP